MAASEKSFKLFDYINLIALCVCWFVMNHLLAYMSSSVLELDAVIRLQKRITIVAIIMSKKKIGVKFVIIFYLKNILLHVALIKLMFVF